MTDERNWMGTSLRPEIIIADLDRVVSITNDWRVKIQANPEILDDLNMARGLCQELLLMADSLTSLVSRAYSDPFSETGF